MSDLPDYQRNIQIVAGEADVAEYDSDPQDLEDGERGPLLVDVKGRLWTLADHKRVKGVDLKDPTIEASVPISIENPAIAYNLSTDRFKVDVEKIVEVSAAITDDADRLLGRIYGSQGQQLQQKASTYELLTYDSFLEAKLAGGLPEALDTGALKIKEQSPLAALKIWDGSNYLATPGVGDAIARGVFIYGSDYGSPTPVARIVKVDSSGRFSCVLG